MDAATEMQRLQALYDKAVLLHEGGQPAVLLPEFSFKVAERDETMNLLLVPQAHSGYATRLFFERQIAGRGKNWTQHYVAGKPWWAPSWKDVAATLSWTSMLCAHLRAVA